MRRADYAEQVVQMKRVELVEPVFIKYLADKLDDLRMQVELAAVRLALGRSGLAFETLKGAVEKGGEPCRAA